MKTGRNALRKLFTALAVLLMVISVSACTGSKDEPAEPASSSSAVTGDQAETDAKEDQEAESSTEDDEAEEETAKEEDESSSSGRDTDELKNKLAEAYMGLTEDGAGVYYAGSLDGEIGLLMLLDEGNAEHYVFVGPVVDNGGGSVTITDEQDGLTLTFSVYDHEDGIEIDMGDDLGTAVLEETDVDEVIDRMIEIESSTTALSVESTADLSYLNDIITEAYLGIFEDDSTVYIANNDDGSFMVVALLSPDETQSISIIGTASAEDNLITVTDEDNGDEISFEVTVEDETLILDMGEMGVAKAGKVEIANMIKALELIATETEALR